MGSSSAFGIGSKKNGGSRPEGGEGKLMTRGWETLLGLRRHFEEGGGGGVEGRLCCRKDRKRLKLIRRASFEKEAAATGSRTRRSWGKPLRHLRQEGYLLGNQAVLEA